MSLFHTLQLDERTRTNTGYAAAVWLGVTQLLLAGVVAYRLYVLGQPDEQLRDFQAILAISVFGYLALQLVLGGVMPVLTMRGAVVAYLVLAATITTVCLMIYGWPEPAQWADSWLPALLGPALLVGAYMAAARLGRWRIERQIGEAGD
jgi:hypothetical protein